MSQHDYNLADQQGEAFRQDLNNSLLAIVSQNSGANEPATKFAFQWWADTTTGTLKMRNADNNAWVNMLSFTGGVADGSITTANIADANVTALKIADSAVTTIKINDGAVTLAKLAAIYGTSGANKLLQLDGTGKLPEVDGSQLTNLPTPSVVATSSATSSLNASCAGYLTGNNVGAYICTNYNRTPNSLGYGGTWINYNQTNSSGQNTLYGWIRTA